jgi:hypothetical protein
MAYVLAAVCVLVVLWHVFLVPPDWPEEDGPLAEIYNLDDYR